MYPRLASLMIVCSMLFACNAATPAQSSEGPKAESISMSATANRDTSGLAKAYFASGCFWCVEAIYESVIGVEEAISGYAGGTTKNPTYEEVGTGTTGHAEAVVVYYDPEKVSFQTLVEVFFGSHDPTTPNRQGPDRGPEYRSIAFYQNAEEKAIIEGYIQKLNEDQAFAGRIVTEVKAFESFYPAEEYHQDYERHHPENPYVRAVSIPRLKRFQEKYPQLIKPGKVHK